MEFWSGTLNGFPVSVMDSEVYGADCDQKDKLRHEKLLLMTQQLSFTDDENLRLNYGLSYKRPYIWIISGMSLRLKRRLSNGESFRIIAYCRNCTSLIYNRDYIFLCGGEWIGGASTVWIQCDPETHKPLRNSAVIPESLKLLNVPVLGFDSLRMKNRRLIFDSEWEISRRAMYSSLDFNGHVTNTKYIAAAMDAFYSKYEDFPEILSLDINFIKEVLINESLEIQGISRKSLRPGDISSWMHKEEWEKVKDCEALLEGIKTSGELSFKAVLGFDGIAGKRLEYPLEGSPVRNRSHSVY